MKICVVGNSQVGAIEEARGPVTAPGAVLAGTEIDTYAVAGGRGPHLKIEDGRIFPEKNAKRLFSSIPGVAENGLELSCYDAVLFVGAGLPAQRVSFDFHVLNKLADAAFCTRPTARRQLVSHGFFSQAICEDMLKSDTLRGIGLLRDMFAGPILVQGSPLPSRGITERADCDLDALYGDNLGPFLSAYFRTQKACLDSFCATLNAQALPHPVAEAFETGFTPDEFRGAEAWHMNVAYGEKILTSAIAELVS